MSLYLILIHLQSPFPVPPPTLLHFLDDFSQGGSGIQGSQTSVSTLDLGLCFSCCWSHLSWGRSCLAREGMRNSSGYTKHCQDGRHCPSQGSLHTRGINPSSGGKLQASVTGSSCLQNPDMWTALPTPLLRTVSRGLCTHLPTS